MSQALTTTTRHSHRRIGYVPGCGGSSPIVPIPTCPHVFPPVSRRRFQCLTGRPLQSRRYIPSRTSRASPEVQISLGHGHTVHTASLDFVLRTYHLTLQCLSWPCREIGDLQFVSVFTASQPAHYLWKAFIGCCVSSLTSSFPSFFLSSLLNSASIKLMYSCLEILPSLSVSMRGSNFLTWPSPSARLSCAFSVEPCCATAVRSMAPLATNTAMTTTTNMTLVRLDMIDLLATSFGQY